MFGWFKRKKKVKEQEKQQKEQVITPEVIEEPEVIEPEVVEPKVVESNVADQTEEEPKQVEAEKEEEPEQKEKKERKLPYHITKHPKGGWQIKKGKADRALKRFDTQKEAIEYAKEMEKSSGISYIIHKADGSIRKKEY
jgi:hypothetical protein